MAHRRLILMLALAGSGCTGVSGTYAQGYYGDYGYGQPGYVAPPPPTVYYPSQPLLGYGVYSGRYYGDPDRYYGDRHWDRDRDWQQQQFQQREQAAHVTRRSGWILSVDQDGDATSLGVDSCRY